MAPTNTKPAMAARKRRRRKRKTKSKLKVGSCKRVRVKGGMRWMCKTRKGMRFAKGPRKRARKRKRR